VKNPGTVVVALICLLVGGLVAFGFQKLASPRLWSSTMGEVHSTAPEEILVMRTPGGLLEVSRIRAVENVDTKFVHTLIGIPVGKTIPRIRVPAVYRYHIELAPQWRVLRTGHVFTVVAPTVKPSLPVAVDLRHIEKQASGTWMLLPFTQTDALDALEREITAKLAQKAASPAYIELQRAAARQTVTEFVSKWLVTQAQWQADAQSRIRVLFADEPVGALNQ
jgi:hypothetical protein